MKMTTKKHTVRLEVRVRAPAGMSARRVAELVSKLLDVGYSDARETAAMFHECDDASQVMGLSILKPKVIR